MKILILALAGASQLAALWPSQANGVQAGSSSARNAEAIPWSEIGAKAGAGYQGERRRQASDGSATRLRDSQAGTNAHGAE